MTSAGDVDRLSMASEQPNQVSQRKYLKVFHKHLGWITGITGMVVSLAFKSYQGGN